MPGAPARAFALEARGFERYAWPSHRREGTPMIRLRMLALALVALLAASLPARADSGTITLQFIKAGWVVGGSFGEGVLNFRGRMYAVSIGGLSYGFTF